MRKSELTVGKQYLVTTERDFPSTRYRRDFKPMTLVDSRAGWGEPKGWGYGRSPERTYDLEDGTKFVTSYIRRDLSGGGSMVLMRRENGEHAVVRLMDIKGEFEATYAAYNETWDRWDEATLAQNQRDYERIVRNESIVGVLKKFYGIEATANQRGSFGFKNDIVLDSDNAEALLALLGERG